MYVCVCVYFIYIYIYIYIYNVWYVCVLYIYVLWKTAVSVLKVMIMSGLYHSTSDKVFRVLYVVHLVFRQYVTWYALLRHLVWKFN